MSRFSRTNDGRIIDAATGAIITDCQARLICCGAPPLLASNDFGQHFDASTGEPVSDAEALAIVFREEKIEEHLKKSGLPSSEYDATAARVRAALISGIDPVASDADTDVNASADTDVNASAETDENAGPNADASADADVNDETANDETDTDETPIQASAGKQHPGKPMTRQQASGFARSLADELVAEDEAAAAAANPKRMPLPPYGEAYTAPDGKVAIKR